jgi:Pyridoxamine 5'-phosphate oxidase
MTDASIDTTLDPRFSDPDATATPWASAREELGSAKTYWVVTMRRDGRPHATTTAGVWLDDAMHLVTGPSEQKAVNLEGNDHVIVMTGCNGWEGLDVVVEGHAVRVNDVGRLEAIARAFTDKYDDFFGFRVVDGRLTAAGTTDESLAFVVRATKALGFAKGEAFGQTRWRFGDGGG